MIKMVQMQQRQKLKQQQQHLRHPQKPEPQRERLRGGLWAKGFSRDSYLLGTYASDVMINGGD